VQSGALTDLDAIPGFRGCLKNSALSEASRVCCVRLMGAARPTIRCADDAPASNTSGRYGSRIRETVGNSPCGYSSKNDSPVP
jgi:hypothetical protein